MARTGSLLVVGALVLAACGGGDDSTETGDAPTEQTDVAEDGSGAADEPSSPDEGTGDETTASDEGTATEAADPLPEATGELDPSALSTDPVDLAMIADVAFTPPIECPLVSYEAANGDLGRNLQTIEVTETGCIFDNANSRILEVELRDPAGFDAASPDLISEMDPVIVVEPQDGPGTNAVLMYDNGPVELGTGDKPLYYGFAFEQDGQLVLILGHLAGLPPEQFRAVADDVSAKMSSATMTPASGEVVAEGPGWCSVWGGDELVTALGISQVKSATRPFSGYVGCDWAVGFANTAANLRTDFGNSDPSQADPSLQIDSLGVPAAFSPFYEEVLTIDVDGLWIDVQGTTPEAAVMLAANLLERLGS